MRRRQRQPRGFAHRPRLLQLAGGNGDGLPLIQHQGQMRDRNAIGMRDQTAGFRNRLAVIRIGIAIGDACRVRQIGFLRAGECIAEFGRAR